jgi:chaperone BCS1
LGSCNTRNSHHEPRERQHILVLTQGVLPQPTPHISPIKKACCHQLEDRNYIPIFLTAILNSEANIMFDGKGYQGIQMLGLMNALKTGDPTADAMIAMFLPVALTKLVHELGRYGTKEQWWSRFKFLSKRCYKRSISYRTNAQGSNQNNSFHDDSYNCFLIKAIKLYMHRFCHFDPEEVNLELMDTTSLSVCEDNNDQLQWVPPKYNKNNNSKKANSASTFGMLQNCTIIHKPIKQKWHEIGTFDGEPVSIWISESSTDGGSNNKKQDSEGDGQSPTQSIELRMKSNGPTSIDTFVDKAYNWFMSELKKEEADDRFLYDLRGFDGRGSHKFPVFGNYKLGDEKTFASLFSVQCQDLLKIVDQFQSKSGKYSVPGYPYKLGLLLHGPPGTGKTSLIKALAHYTNRHLVNVPLSRVQTNQELMTLFYNKRYMVAGNPKPSQLGFEDFIFVLEDIDASCEVVKRRGARRTDDSPESRKSALKEISPPMGHSTTSATAATKPTFRLDDDELNLTGLLNVLDGVVDTPGRIVIMTTNHPEVLDPALIRPGRIDKKLELSYMVDKDVIAMLEHYYQTKLSDSEKQRVRLAIDGDGKSSKPLKLVPALVEQLAMEEETIDAMIQWIENKRASTTLDMNCSVTDMDESSTEASLDA